MENKDNTLWCTYSGATVCQARIEDKSRGITQNSKGKYSKAFTFLCPLGVNEKGSTFYEQREDIFQFNNKKIQFQFYYWQTVSDL